MTNPGWITCESQICAMSYLQKTGKITFLVIDSSLANEICKFKKAFFHIIFRSRLLMDYIIITIQMFQID